MKAKGSRPSPKNHTPGEIRYLNYSLEFPDGEVWQDFTHIAGGFHSWVKNTAIWRQKPDAVRHLLMEGECHWKDHNGVTHRMQVSETACTRKWGTGKQIKRTALEMVR